MFGGDSAEKKILVSCLISGFILFSGITVWYSANRQKLNNSSALSSSVGTTKTSKDKELILNKRYIIRSVENEQNFKTEDFDDFKLDEVFDSYLSSDAVNKIQKYLEQKKLIPDNAELFDIEVREAQLIHNVDNPPNLKTMNTYILHYGQKSYEGMVFHVDVENGDTL